MFGATNKLSQATASSSGAAHRAPAEELSPAAPTTLLRPRPGPGAAGSDAVPSGLIAGGIQQRPAGSGEAGNAPVSSGIVGYAPAPGSPNPGASGQFDTSASGAGETSTARDNGAAELSSQDRRRLAGLDDLRKNAPAIQSRGTPDAVAHFRRIVHELIDRLGVRRGEPGADEKRALIAAQGNVPPETLTMIDHYAISRAELEAALRRQNGLKDPRMTEQFVSDMQGFEGDWSAMAPAERADSIGHRINARLRDIGVPEVKIKTAPLDDGTVGQFDNPTWSIEINERNLQAPQISAYAVGKLINLVYHEARHAEQFFLIARFLKQHGGSPADVAKRAAIPLPVCEAATKAPPLSRAQAAAAKVFFDSIFGTGARHGEQVFAALDRTTAMLSAAQQAHRAMARDPNRTKEEKQQTAREVQRLHDLMVQIHQDYEALPEEKDAIEVGTAARRVYETVSGTKRASAATPVSGPNSTDAASSGRPSSRSLQ